ncbi:MAG: phenylacetate--CoA ligase family protein, partial [candidate division NC10 bacterium]|nr:phenylacetate--CoA ligase family protein [candidate division NC10 bacterium]
MNLQTLIDPIIRVGARAPRGFLGFVQALPPSLLASLRRQAFRRTLRLAAARSPFYRRKFAQHGIDPAKVREPQDLGDFFLEPEELKGTPPEEFLCGRPELAIESSGTTGHITRVFLSRKELGYSARQGVFFRALYHMTEEDRVLCTLDYAFGLGGLIVQRGLSYRRGFSMCVGRVDPLEVYRRMPVYQFNVIISDPFWLSRLTEIAREQGRPYPLKLLVGGGEGITRQARESMEGFWEAPLCMTYASTEAATVLGSECLRREGYHLNEFDFSVEIADPDPDGYGEVVLTTVHRAVMPLIRYRTRDIARLIEEPCPCGFPFRRLSAIRGRLDELVPCVWGNVHPEFFETLLHGIPGLAD